MHTSVRLLLGISDVGCCLGSAWRTDYGCLWLVSVVKYLIERPLSLPLHLLSYYITECCEERTQYMCMCVCISRPASVSTQASLSLSPITSPLIHFTCSVLAVPVHANLNVHLNVHNESLMWGAAMMTALCALVFFVVLLHHYDVITDPV